MAGSVHESVRQLTLLKGKIATSKQNNPTTKKPQSKYLHGWLFTVRQVLLQILVRRKDVLKAVQEWGPSLLAVPLDKVGLLYLKQPPDACCMHLVESRRALYHLALGSGSLNDKLVKHHYCMGSDRDGSITV